MKNYKELASEYKDLVKSYNVNINTNYTGTLIDVFAYATSGILQGSYEYSETVRKGNNLDTADDFSLENWATDMGLVRRKTGFFANGTVIVEIDSDELVVPKGTIFSLSELQYQVIVDTVVTQANPAVQVTAVQVGAEYNIRAGVVLQSTLSGVTLATSQFIGGGSGVETSNELRQRIRTNLAFRKTDSMASDFTQFGLETFNYAYTVPIFMQPPYEVIPIGARLIVANTIQDYSIAASNPEINNISASAGQLEELKERLDTLRNVVVQFEVATLETQVVNGLVVRFTADTILSVETKAEIIKRTREALLQYQGEILYPRSLTPDIKDLVTSYYFQNFNGIEKTSLIMDSITITAVQDF